METSPRVWQKATTQLCFGRDCKHRGCVWFYITGYLQISNFDYSVAF